MVFFGHPDDAATDFQMAWSTSAGHCLRWSPPRPQDNSGTGPFYPKAPMGTEDYGAIMPAIEPLALSPRDAAQFLSISKRSLSRLIARRKIAARKDGPRTLVDVASLKAYYESLPLKTDHAPIVFGRRAHLLPRSHLKVPH